MQVMKTIICLLTACALSLAGNQPAWAEPIAEEKGLQIAARVNDRPIYYHQIKANVERTLAKYKRLGAAKVSDDVRKQVQKDEINRQVDMELLVQAGEKLKQTDLEKKMEALLSLKSPQGSTSAKKDESKEKEMREQLRRNLLAESYLIQRGIQDVRVPEEDLKRFYKDNSAKFTVPEAVKASHIMITVNKKATPEEIAQANAKIVKVREEVLQGKKSFEELAKEHSSGDSASKGGDLGYINPQFMPPEFDKVAFQLKVGEVSDVVKTKFGFHVIKVFDKKPSRVQEFAEVKGLLEKFLLNQYQERKRTEIAMELRRDARIEVSLK
ncbi:peptidylprolyl cis-trans isomerase, PpiC-type [Citrifermentans bemidjiense Bem]|uniref:Peptidylprolyl cis-trans isomerase, PpiC-type n=1 Tax=Citrifermentans bemidjiense (strain ATCC BAA-1014 / DSM 16622 / JCM 12645 / Bem) TaxID=404380 RepID=B5E887_CITBB|nr:peptidylprolyl isomerase [Citrifermentans bemidjiense]ACH40056.1 peptidylprolyl cis-trans isomerase, PpiC-type [Citrifermentans bemidjiense Bem]